jgi:Family of unknown function (DUF6992)
MWSDTLLAAERSHLIRIAVWAATSAVFGTALVTTITLRRLAAPILLWFAIQTLAWGSLELIISAARWRALSMRDVSAATRLDRLTWFGVGLDVGVVAMGVVAIALAWAHRRRLGAFGGGLGIVVQGLGLLVLDLTFASILARLV